MTAEISIIDTGSHPEPKENAGSIDYATDEAELIAEPGQYQQRTSTPVRTPSPPTIYIMESDSSVDDDLPRDEVHNENKEKVHK